MLLHLTGKTRYDVSCLPPNDKPEKRESNSNPQPNVHLPCLPSSSNSVDNLPLSAAFWGKNQKRVSMCRRRWILSIVVYRQKCILPPPLRGENYIAIFFLFFFMINCIKLLMTKLIYIQLLPFIC